MRDFRLALRDTKHEVVMVTHCMDLVTACFLFRALARNGMKAEVLPNSRGLTRIFDQPFGTFGVDPTGHLIPCVKVSKETTHASFTQCLAHQQQIMAASCSLPVSAILQHPPLSDEQVQKLKALFDGPPTETHFLDAKHFGSAADALKPKPLDDCDGGK